jgi:DNA invertase Pin-like site-specific DNA recombinase
MADAEKRRPNKRIRCAIYTRKSTDEGLEQAFNSLDAQREACAAFIQSQKHEGWAVLPAQYDDGGYSGGTLERPALERLLADIEAGQVDVVVVYKVDRLTRALSDFAKLVEVFDRQAVSFVSITQQFNTTSSMGRLTLNVLLSFAQFEREVIGERVRDKIAASKKKGMAGCHRLDTTSRTASSSSIRARRALWFISTAAIWPSDQCAICMMSLRLRGSEANDGLGLTAPRMAAKRSLAVLSIRCYRTASTGARSPTRATRIPESTPPSSTSHYGTRFRQFSRKTASGGPQGHAQNTQVCLAGLYLTPAASG